MKPLALALAVALAAVLSAPSTTEAQQPAPPSDAPADSDPPDDAAAPPPDEPDEPVDEAVATPPPAKEAPDDTGDPRALPDQAPVTAPGQPPSAEQPERGIADALGSRRPPRFLRSYRIEGTLRDPKEVVRGFLDSTMPVNEVWTDEAEIALLQFCKRIGYHVTVLNQPVGTNEVIAVLNLQPVTLVRRINADVKRSYLAVFTDELFDEDIVQRMRMRPGDPLALDDESRAAQLRDEERRLVEYLRDEGFFDAQVGITAVPDGRFGVSLEVDVDAGEAYKIGKIRVTGNTEVPTSEIVALFKHKRLLRAFFDKRFNRDQFKRDVDQVAELYQKRGFPGVRVRTDFGRTSFKRNTKTVEFTVTVRERRRVEIVFEGNRKLQDRQLRVQLTLDEEGSYDDYEIERSAQALRAYYQSRGYFEASVVWERFTFRLGQLFDRIVFTIDEGPQMKVARVEFSGNDFLSSRRLRTVVRTREFPRVGFLASGGFATSQSLQQDAERIRAAYRAAGYANVEVDYEVTRDRRLLGNAPALAAAIVSEAPAEGLFVRFLVREGERQKVARVEFIFEGEHRQTAEELSERLSLRQGEPYTAQSLENDRAALRRLYFELGFPHAKVATAARPACKIRYGARRGVCIGGEFADRVVVVHRIRENQFVTLGQVAVRGNFRTKSWVLLDQLKLRPGAAFTLARAERAQRGLRSTGLFSTVRFDFVGLEEDNQQDVVNVVVNVEERFDHSVELRAGGGYSTDQKVFGETGVTFPHLFDIGARLDLQAQAGPELQTIQSKFTLQPWILRRVLGVGVRFENDIFYRREDTERFDTLQTLGVNAGLSREGATGTPWEGWFAALRYTFRIRDRAEDLVRPAGPSDDIQQTQVLTRTGAVGPLIVVDRRRDKQGRINPLAAVRGFRLELSALFADTLLGGDDRFIKLGFRGQHVLSLGPRVLVTNGARYDHGIPLAGSLLPEVERFFAGGDNTVRGFEEDRLLGEIVRDDLPPLQGVQQFTVRPAGGNVRFIHNLDVQFTVWDRGPILDFPWASAVFVDTGIVTNSLDKFDVRDLRHSLGIAFWRMLTPFGGFSFEWAVPLDPTLGDNPRGRFHFNLGFVFQ